MRNATTMMSLILNYARQDERIRAVVLNGSRANPNVPDDDYKDYDIVYLVETLDSFLVSDSWLDFLGERLLMQKPETMRDPADNGTFNWMMLFKDGNRIDLTLIPITLQEEAVADSLSIVCLDKDNRFVEQPQPSEVDYITSKPSRLYFESCHNNFWWCMQNVAKGLARNEIPYALTMYQTVVHEELNLMLTWFIGAQYQFSVNSGKMGKFFRKYLSSDIYERYLQTYTNSDITNIWEAIDCACTLFSELTNVVSIATGYSFNKADEDNLRYYLSMIKKEMD